MTRATETPAPSLPPPRRRPWPAALPFVLVTAIGIWAYWGVWRGEFVFDDHGAIAENAALRAGDWWRAAFGDYQSLANRPLACLSLVLDFAVHGEGPRGPHLGNLLLHLGNALLLLLVARRALQAPNLVSRRGAAGATWLPTAIAAIWVCHPLGVDAVAYATQRSTLLFSGFLLLALYATSRAHGARRPLPWHVLVWLALACGMASKEEMVLGPVVVVLFERAFLVPTWRELRTNALRYGILALTWSVLAACVALGPANLTVGYSTQAPVTAWQWLLTEAPVVVHYLRLSLWPQGLRGAYDWRIVRDLGPAVAPGLLVLAVLVATIACWRRRPWWGWLGALFFLLLAPTSTVMPIVTELVAERRAYLPMLFPLVVALVAGFGALRRAAGHRAPWLAAIGAALIVLGLGSVTRQRVLVYRSDASLWADAIDKLDPDNRSPAAARILGSHAATLRQAGRFEASHALLDRAMACEDMSTNCVVLYALSLVERGRAAAAVAVARRLVQLDTGPKAATVLGICLAAAHAAEGGRPDDPRLAEAEAAFLRGAPGLPDEAEFWRALAHLQAVRGQFEEAERCCRRVMERRPGDVPALLLRAALLERLARAEEIAAIAEPVLHARSQDVDLRLQLATIAARSGERTFAADLLRQILALEPANQRAASMQRALQQSPR